MMTLGEVIERSQEAGMAAEIASGWLIGFKAEPQTIVGPVIYVRDWRRPDGSESGIGESRIPGDSPAYWAEYRRVFRELSQDCPEAAKIIARSDAARDAAREQSRKIDAQLRAAATSQPCGGWHDCGRGIYSGTIYRDGWQHVYIHAPDGAPACIPDVVYQSYGQVVRAVQGRQP